MFVTEEKDGKLTAAQRFVTLGPKRGDQVAILKGVAEGDTVITSGQIKIQNGSAIAVNNSVVPDNKATPAPSDH